MTLSSPVAPAPADAGVFRPTRPAARERHLIGLEGISRDALIAWLDEAERERGRMLAGGPNRADLAGCVVLLAFIEDSTRTRVSFEIATRRLGGDPVSFAAGASSLNKGESLLDTMKLFEAMRADVLVVRHPVAGVAAMLASELGLAVINAGDGAHEHPTQGLLDLLTLRDAWDGRFEGRRLAIVGDIAHSRVARSAIAGLTTLGAAVTVAGPGTLVPADVEGLGCTIAPTVEDALEGADGVMALRLQRERMESGLLPSIGEYARVWGLHADRVRLMRPDAVVLHPGPVNRGVEMTAEVADSPRSRILAQVANGVPVRCAVLRRSWDALRADRGEAAA